MGTLGILSLMTIPFSIIGLICGIIIVIHAFQKDIWKGLLCLFCGIYAIIYGITEFEHEKKPLILTGFLASTVLGIVLQVVSLTMGAGGLTALKN